MRRRRIERIYKIRTVKVDGQFDDVSKSHMSNWGKYHSLLSQREFRGTLWRGKAQFQSILWKIIKKRN